MKYQKAIFADFTYLQDFFQTGNWETEVTDLESRIKSIVQEHLDVPLQISKSIFQKMFNLNLISLIWIVQLFAEEEIDLSYLNVWRCSQTFDPKSRF